MSGSTRLSSDSSEACYSSSDQNHCEYEEEHGHHGRVAMTKPDLPPIEDVIGSVAEGDCHNEWGVAAHDLDGSGSALQHLDPPKSGTVGIHDNTIDRN